MVRVEEMNGITEGGGERQGQERGAHIVLDRLLRERYHLRYADHESLLVLVHSKDLAADEEFVHRRGSDREHLAYLEELHAPDDLDHRMTEVGMAERGEPDLRDPDTFHLLAVAKDRHLGLVFEIGKIELLVCPCGRAVTAFRARNAIYKPERF
ncbi:hypothetical protein DSECCO2_521280 [anaerobic digester metagenome]